MKLTTILMLISISTIEAKNFLLMPPDYDPNNPFFNWKVILGVSTVIDCSKFLTTLNVNHSSNNQFCDPTNDPNGLCFQNARINNSTNDCPLLVIDNLMYTINTDINIYQINKLTIVGSSVIANCKTPQGVPPTIGFSSILSVANTTLGIANMSFDYNNWILTVNSIDGNLTCDGSIGIVGQDMFNNGFEAL